VNHGHPVYVPGCPECRARQRVRVARNRAERLAEGRLSHGKRSAYDAGCRCYRCEDARQEAYERNPGEYPAKRGAGS
jgi:hypothetical protein